MNDRHQEPSLPPRATLDTWTVPELPDDFADRVVEAWHGELARDRRTDTPMTRPSRAWRRWGIAAAAAALAAAAVVAWWLRPVAPQPYVPTVVLVTTPAPAVVVEPPPQVAAPVPIPPLPEAEATTLRLSVEVEPADARVRVLDDDDVVMFGSGEATFVLPAPEEGHSYTVEASAEGYVTQRTGIEVEGDEATLRMELTEVPTPKRTKASDKDEFFPGRAETPTRPSPTNDCILRLGAKAGVPPARVSVDGKRIGTTPVASYRVTCGRHKVVWEWADGRTLSETVVLANGESRTLKRG